MIMKIKNSEFINSFVPAFNDLTSLEGLEARLIYGIKKSGLNIRNGSKAYFETRQEISEKLAAKDSDGKLVLKSTIIETPEGKKQVDEYTFEKPEDKLELNKQIKDLDNLEIEIDIHPVSYICFGGISKISGNMIIDLRDFVED